MKTLFIAVTLSLLATTGLQAQSSADELNRDTKYYDNLAVKLFPDCAVANSPFVNMMYKVDSVIKANNSKVYYLTTKPFIEATVAATLTNTSPHWDALTEGEKNICFKLVVFGLMCTHDLSPSEAGLISTTPAPKPFNPGSIDDPAPSSQSVAPQVSSTPVPTNPNIKPTRNGYLYFYNDLVNKSGGLMGRKSAAPAYESGPLQGMTEGEGKAYAQQQWQALTPDQQMACEQNAATFGPGPDPDAPTETHTYNYQSNGMGGGTITGQ